MLDNQTLLRICGTVGIIAGVFPIAADVVSWLLADGYNPVAQSVSALAVGPSSWLIDLGLWSFVLACLTVAVGLWTWMSDERLANATAAALILVGVCVGVVARVNQYAGTDNPNANVHLWAVCLLGASFALTSFLAAQALGRHSPGLARFSLGIAIAWVVICPIYWFFTDAWSGAVERLLALLMVGWLVALARRLRAAAADPVRRHARA